MTETAAVPTPETPTKQQIHPVLDRDLVDQARHEAIRRRIRLNKLVAMALRAFLGADKSAA